MKKNFDVNYKEFEANVLFSLSTFVSYKISRLERLMDKRKINTAKYLEIRKKYISEIEEFKKKIEEIGND